jgi:hypothetical protein
MLLSLVIQQPGQMSSHEGHCTCRLQQPNSSHPSPATAAQGTTTCKAPQHLALTSCREEVCHGDSPAAMCPLYESAKCVGQEGSLSQLRPPACEDVCRASQQAL